MKQLVNLRSMLIDYTYDNDEVLGFIYNGTPYYYLKNQQGDVLSIVDANNNIVASYTYDAWGKVTAFSGAMADINPIRYRSYYYDKETNLYYLQSRYYDPETGRFLNADDVDYLGARGTVLSYNLFAYCENAPIDGVDFYGNYYIISTKARMRAFINNAAYLYLNRKGCNASYRLLRHSLYGNGNLLSFSDLNLILYKIKSSSYFNMLWQNALFSNRRRSSFSFGAVFTRAPINDKAGRDLGWALGKVDFYVTRQGNRFLVEAIDRYDYTTGVATIRQGISVTNIANDAAYMLMRYGVMVPYGIYLKFYITAGVNC